MKKHEQQIQALKLKQLEAEKAICEKCDKSFKSMEGLRLHSKNMHTEKRLQCQYCSKKYNDVRLRDDHERTHTGEKPYNCSFCEKTFSSYKSLKNHEVFHRRKYQSFLHQTVIFNVCSIHGITKTYSCVQLFYF